MERCGGARYEDSVLLCVSDNMSPLQPLRHLNVSPGDLLFFPVTPEQMNSVYTQS